MQQLSWKNFPVKIEKSLCKLFGPKYAPNPVHNSVTIHSVKALSVFLCVKGASPPRRRGGLRGRLPQPRWGCFPLPGGRLSNRAYCLHFSEHTGVEALNSAKNWLKTRIILEKQFVKWYRTIWPCRGLRHRGTPHGRGDQQGDTKPRGAHCAGECTVHERASQGAKAPGRRISVPRELFSVQLFGSLKNSLRFSCFYRKIWYTDSTCIAPYGPSAVWTHYVWRF